MHYDLNLAIAYVCTMGLLMWLAFGVVPAVFGALVRSTAKALRSRNTRSDREPPNAGGHDTWWGPVHHSH